jgi:DNA polymerase IIIc chi subunit
MSNSKNTITTKSKSELITTSQADTICEKLTRGLTLTEILEEKQYEFSLMKFYHFLKKNPEMNERITEARKNGVQTLIDKLLQVFQYQQLENPNQILWIREKTKFITFLDNKVQNVKTDQSIKISWEDNQSDMIDVSADTVVDTSDNKDL